MTKITLNDLSTISGNEQSAINLINANNAVIETASDNTLSRDGTSPNQMLSSLDMNSFRILNLSDAINVTEPATYGQVLSFISNALTPGTPLLGTGVATWLTTPTSANLKAAVTDETGSGILVFNTSPILVTPVLGAATATSLLITGSTPLNLTVSNAGIELGSTVSSNTPFIDFHSSGNAIDFDCRIIANGGTGVSGNGALSFSCGNLLPIANDSVALGTGALSFSDLFLASGGVVNWNNGDVTIAHFADGLTFTGAASGYFFNGLQVSPASNDGCQLGQATGSWSDLFLADGGVINWNNGNTTLTHSAGVLTNSGAWSQIGSMAILSGTAVPAGGTTSVGFKISSAANFGIFFGSGAPTLSAAQGSIYLRSDGGANTRIYSNNNGTTGWSPMTG